MTRRLAKDHGDIIRSLLKIYSSTRLKREIDRIGRHHTSRVGRWPDNPDNVHAVWCCIERLLSLKQARTKEGACKKLAKIHEEKITGKSPSWQTFKRMYYASQSLQDSDQVSCKNVRDQLDQLMTYPKECLSVPLLKNVARGQRLMMIATLHPTTPKK